MKKILTSFLILFFANISFGQSNDFLYTPTCYGSQTTLVGSSTYQDSDIQSWQWDIDGNGTYDLSGKTIIYLFTSNDTVSVKLKITPNIGPTDSVTKTVIIDPPPNVNFRVDNLCANKQATYFNQSTILSGNIDQFLWDFNNDGIVDDNSNDTVNYTCGPAQSYITKLTCISDKGCSAFATKSTIVYPQPIASFTVSDTCEGQNTVFTNTSSIVSLDFYIWNFGDGSESTETSPSHIYDYSGNYNVYLIAFSQNGCRDTSDFNTISINPFSDVTIMASDTIIYGNGNQVQLTVNSQGGNIQWSNGMNNPTIGVNYPGTYWVSVTNQFGCQGTDSIHIYQTNNNNSGAEITLESNILTPNGDDINDSFKVKNYQNYRCLELQIFNMWNDRVFWTDHCYDNNWRCQLNGNGNTLPDGAYYYIIKADEIVVKGTFNILIN